MNYLEKIVLLLALIIFLFIFTGLGIAKEIGIGKKTTRVVLKFSPPAEKEEEPSQLKGIAVDKDRNILVVDEANNRILRFDEEGNYLSQLGTSGSNEGEFSSPSYLAIDSKGNIFVVDTGNQRVQKFKKGGIFEDIFVGKETLEELLKKPEGIAIDFFDNVYLVDRGSNCLYKFNKEGWLLWKLGSSGKGKGEFNQPTGITLDKNLNIYVVDTGNQRVQKFDSQGNFLFQFGSRAEGAGYFIHPQGIALDKEGNIYVVDASSNLIQKFSPQGKFIAQWGGDLSEDFQFNSPVDLAIDSLDYIYVVDRGNNRIVKIAKPLSTNIIITGEKTFDFSYANVTEGSSTQFFASYPDTYPGLNLYEELRVDARTEHLGEVEVLGHLSDSNDTSKHPDMWLEIESQKSGIRLGSYRAPFNDTEFSSYNSILNGVKVRTQMSNLEIEAIGAKIKGIPQRDEIQAEEMELTYILSRCPILEGSEEVKVNGELKKKNIDYEIDYLTGRITFDQFLEPDSTIVVEYQYIPQRKVYEGIIYGVRGKGKVGQNLTLGTTFLYKSDETLELPIPKIDTTPTSCFLYGVDINYDLPNNLTSYLEYAQSELDPNLLDEAWLDDMEGNAQIVALSDKASDWEKIEEDVGSFLYLREDFTYRQEGESSLALDYVLDPYSWVYCSQSFIPPKDYSPFKSLQFWCISDASESVNLSIQLVEGGVVYSFTFSVDWQDDWKIVKINLPTDFSSEEENHPSLKEVEEIRLKVTNPTQQSLSGTLYIDTLSLSLEKRWGKIELDTGNSLEVGPINEEIDPGFTPYPPTASSSPQALSLRYTFNREEKETYVSVTQNLPGRQDFSPYQKLEFGLFKKAEGSQGTLSIDLMSSSQDFFRYTLPLDFASGWRTLTLNLDDFIVYGLPLRKAITSIRLYITKADAPPGEEKEIYIDALHLKGGKLIRAGAFKVKMRKKIGSLDLNAQYKEIESGFTMIEEARQANDRETMEVGARCGFTRNTWVDLRYKSQSDTNNEQAPGGVDKTIDIWRLSLNHRWGVSNLTTDYQTTNFTDYTQKQPSSVKSTANIRLNTSLFKKITLSGSYSIYEDKTFLENPSTKVTTTTTTTLNLRARPNRILSINSSYSVREVKDSLPGNTSFQTTTANVMLGLRPTRAITSSIKYGVKVANGVRANTTTLLNLKITPSYKLSITTSYEVKATYDILRNIITSSTTDAKLIFTMRPTKSLLTLARYTIKNTGSNISQNSNEEIFARVNYIFSKVWSSASYKIMRNVSSTKRIFRANLIYNLTKRIRIKGDLQQINSQGIFSNNVKNIATLGLDWRLIKYVWIEGEYSFIDFEDKNESENNYQANRGNLFIRINF